MHRSRIKRAWYALDVEGLIEVAIGVGVLAFIIMKAGGLT
jgi:hypothetical protein